MTEEVVAENEVRPDRKCIEFLQGLPLIETAASLEFLPAKQGTDMMDSLVSRGFKIYEQTFSNEF